ncbi:MAG TPA: FAD-dependent oxidoreductase [Polyangia bacterium]|jgi:heterodisulfide reductase subunit A-like polyferredoxin
MTTVGVGPASGTIMVVGGGIAGLTAALEAAEADHDVVLVEKAESLGGRVARMHRYFPKLCPPSCGLEINLRRVRTNPRIQVLTLAELTAVTGQPGNLEATVRVAPRFVTERCTACGDCLAACPATRPDTFNYGIGTTKAVYLPHALAYPHRFAIDRAACPAGCAACAKACGYGAVDLAMAPRTLTLKVGAVVLATGWEPYDAARLDGLGYGQYPDVITNVMLERLAAPSGPTAGRITRPSDGKAPAHVTFVQCAGSRDEKHLPYCSAVCCLASLKQATYVREQLPEAKVHMFYIDVRSPGRFEDFYTKVAADPNVTLARGKVARVTPAAAGGRLVVEAENTLTSERVSVETDLVVLATGMRPSGVGDLAAAVTRDGMGFSVTDRHGSAISVAGCARRPADVTAAVQDATGAALHAIQACARRPIHG